MGDLATPGDRLAAESTHTGGLGTYTAEGGIFASFAGRVSVAARNDRTKKPSISVSRKGIRAAVPDTGSTVTVKVVRVSTNLANVEILCVGTQPVGTTFSGIIRRQDVRATEIDKVELLSCFRPGDLVRAVVLSVGDARSYYLSTAKNELGVIYAKSLAGVPMVPISWQEMQCPSTKAIEKRKVAKVTA